MHEITLLMSMDFELVVSSEQAQKIVHGDENALISAMKSPFNISNVLIDSSNIDELESHGITVNHNEIEDEFGSLEMSGVLVDKK